ncbi:fasciclin domain-containing protein [Actinoplanes sp. LDG1-06]|uniref:Fasciclin domain-containing protein n=1 Tax=Paractinoplanes ovalisporus TaxID=2810368 RepID=A0ABS2A5U6_9ACTN|nr:fasciclin domain-containing protein [Actinoplanes ovalisporus]MBM2615095.1 fasciclin domain-containing protein [Actinoplanes ovalisporus]
MRITRAAAVVSAALVACTLSASPAAAHGKPKPLGTKSLAAVLTADKSGFDRNGNDYDILTAAVLAVLKAKPSSPVKVLTDGKVALTAFVPNDRAFQILVADLQRSKRLPGEKAAFTAVAGLGIGTVEGILLYHVVPGATIDRKAALKSDGARLKTAAGAAVKVDVSGVCWKRVKLIDADRNDRDPRVVRFDLNKGNRQIAHGIDRVLRPADLP